MQVNQMWNAVFSTNETQVDHFLRQVNSLLDEEARSGPLQVLDIGCGDGGKLARLAELWPKMSFTGIDISPPNIQQAELRGETSLARDRLNFILGDYRELILPSYDIILAESTLHLIPGTNDELFAKLRSEMKPGGLLLFTIPRRGAFNTLLSITRRVLRLFRSPMTDWLILSLAEKLHGQAHTREFLRERLHYMYILPNRYGSSRFARTLSEQHQLDLQFSARCAHTSLGQPMHSFYSFRFLPPVQKKPRSGHATELALH